MNGRMNGRKEHEKIYMQKQNIPEIRIGMCEFIATMMLPSMIRMGKKIRAINERVNQAQKKFFLFLIWPNILRECNIVHAKNSAQIRIEKQTENRNVNWNGWHLMSNYYKKEKA